MLFIIHKHSTAITNIMVYKNICHDNTNIYVLLLLPLTTSDVRVVTCIIIILNYTLGLLCIRQDPNRSISCCDVTTVSPTDKIK